MSEHNPLTEPKYPEAGAAPPNAERRGLWRVLTISLVLAVVALAGVAIAVG